VSALIRLYPSTWRARYGPEFEALLAERPPSARDVLDIVVSAVDARLSPQVVSAPVLRRVRVTDRMAGAAAMAGGLTWCLAYVAGGLFRVGGDLFVVFLAALGLMLLSLPGTYLVAYARPVALGCLACGISLAVVFGQLLPWGPALLLPVVGILGALGPGALALAAARARVGAGARWRLLLLTMPWPVIGGIPVLSGLVPEAIGVPLAAVSLLPLGIAWVATGARLVRGVVIDAGTPPSNQPASMIANAGGAA
jgi:hypothetical protein